MTMANNRRHNALIEKIVVHEKTTGEDGEKEQTVDIYYRFVGKID